MRSLRAKFAVVLAFLSIPVFAQLPRTFVSAASGDDLNVCSITSPCRNLRRGVEAVAANGEVVTLDSGGYGNLTISKSVTINVPAGVYAGVTALSGSSGVILDTSGINVKLRGLSVNSLGGTNGIQTAVSTVKLSIERSSVSGFPSQGVAFLSNGGNLLVVDSLVRDSFSGIEVSSTDAGSVAIAVIDHCQFSGNGSLSSGAVSADLNSKVTVHDSVAHANFRGFQVVGDISAPATLEIEGCAATGNAVGLFGTAGGGPIEWATMHVSNTLVAHNTLFAIEAQSGSSIYSRGNNTVVDNAANETFSGTFGSK